MKNAAKQNAKLIAEYEEQIQVKMHLTKKNETFKLNFKMFIVRTRLLYSYFHIRLTKRNWQISSKLVNRSNRCGTNWPKSPEKKANYKGLGE